MLALKDLCQGTLESQNIIIEDGSGTSGRLLLLALLHGLCQRCDQVLLLSLSRPSHFFVNILPRELGNKVTPVHVPLSVGQQGKRLTVLDLILAVRGAIEGRGQSVGVVIDSVACLCSSYSLTAVPKLVQSLLTHRDNDNKVIQVISVINSDVFDEAECQVLHGRPHTLIRLRPPLSPRRQYRCLITHGEPFQTPSQYEEEFSISKDCLRVVDVVSVAREETGSSTSASSEQQVDPTANLTFNLSLKPEEKAAKDKVVLPYTQVSNSETQLGGHIHYLPDEDDDFDDEDPDEDLDF